MSLLLATGSGGLVNVTLSLADDDDGLISAAAVLVGADLALADGADALAAGASVAVAVAMSATDAADALNAAAAAQVVASTSLDDAADTLTALVQVDQPEPEVRRSGGRIDDLVRWPVHVRLALRDQDDAARAAATVTRRARAVSLDLTDADDAITARTWSLRLVRSARTPELRRRAVAAELRRAA